MKKNNQNNEFLQSQQWGKFQAAVGRNTFNVKNEDFSALLIEHQLPMVGNYLYCPRGPILNAQNQNLELKSFLNEINKLAISENAGWVRIEPENSGALKIIREVIGEKVVKAPHDVQPKEVFVLDITKEAEFLLTEMKSKTRYNINLAKKKDVEIIIDSKREYVNEFLRLTKEMALRNGITAHPENYYRKMIENLPDEMLKIYVAKFDEQIIAANLVLFYGNTATYLHGASGNVHRNTMAPFLLQWQAILDAKKLGYEKYDFGGIKTSSADNSWEGITQFKFGFSPNTKPLEFPGTYDIIINPRKYAVYRGLQRAKAFAVRFRK